jgi:hypothetical protein
MIHNVRAVKPASFGVAVPKARVAAASRPAMAKAFKVTLETPDGTQEISCEEDEFIVDAAEVRCKAHTLLVTVTSTSLS